ncbi:MAG: hypothetical protein Q8Q56_03190 [Alphaproteobacteria bacterium]|nr:hypothetical protein [Alphaproteobacteria bacterium]
MKKILLATALAAVSLTGVKAESTPAGKGFYVMGQVGGGALFLSGEGKFYEVKEGKLAEMAGDKSKTLFLPALQLNWGYSHRFANDMTVGAEFTVISPAVRFGYMVSDRHHVALGVHFAAVTRFALSAIVDAAEKNLPEEQKKAFELKMDGASGFGASVSYEYFTQAKNFFRVQVRADYYGLEGKVGGVKQLEKGALLPFALEGKGTAWDVTGYVGFGSQW